jgi:hypothetical protein
MALPMRRHRSVRPHGGRLVHEDRYDGGYRHRCLPDGSHETAAEARVAVPFRSRRPVLCSWLQGGISSGRALSGEEHEPKRKLLG